MPLPFDARRARYGTEQNFPEPAGQPLGWRSRPCGGSGRLFAVEPVPARRFRCSLRSAARHRVDRESDRLNSGVAGVRGVFATSGNPYHHNPAQARQIPPTGPFALSNKGSKVTLAETFRHKIQPQTFQKLRPRVALGLNISPMEPTLTQKSIHMHHNDFINKFTIFPTRIYHEIVSQ